MKIHPPRKKRHTTICASCAILFIIPFLLILPYRKARSEEEPDDLAPVTLSVQYTWSLNKTSRNSVTEESKYMHAEIRMAIRTDAFLDLSEAKHKSIHYEEGKLLGDQTEDIGKVVSFTGRTSYFYDYKGTKYCDTDPPARIKVNTTRQGNGVMEPGNGKFSIFFYKDRIHGVSLTSGHFKITSLTSGHCKGGTSKELTSNMTIGIHINPKQRMKDPEWSVEALKTEKGYFIDAKRHHSSQGGSDSGTKLAKKESISIKFDFPTLESKLEYDKTELDVAKLKRRWGEAVDRHIYITHGPDGEGSSWVPHANFAGKVWVNGINKVKINTDTNTYYEQRVHSKYRINRMVRQWGLRKSEKPVLVLPWHPDNSQPIEDWIDTPAVSEVLGAPDTWGKGYGVIDEFLVKVEGNPEFGSINVAFAMEIKKNAYRINYSTPELINDDTYGKILKLDHSYYPNPFRDDDQGWINLGYDKVKKKWFVVDNKKPNP